jgi:hypothetical protein
MGLPPLPLHPTSRKLNSASAAHLHIQTPLRAECGAKTSPHHKSVLILAHSRCEILISWLFAPSLPARFIATTG